MIKHKGRLVILRTAEPRGNFSAALGLELNSRPPAVKSHSLVHRDVMCTRNNKGHKHKNVENEDQDKKNENKDVKNEDFTNGDKSLDDSDGEDNDAQCEGED
ncbi:hypothetical protein RRG08_040844 [Elysia crispata]|uniref:Uncharacterized protein n=1 Tax=Elysia crispata TaxID=231223 RepID=A0AAE1EBH5_9GAST|nr:hypothetical protein RRG08_040844 [Elysia crispata]